MAGCLAAYAEVISIDFSGNEASTNVNMTGAEWKSATETMEPSEAAGLISAPNWNSFGGTAQETPVELIDSRGNPSGVTVAWEGATHGTQTSILDEPGNSRMMRGGMMIDANTATQRGNGMVITIKIPEKLARKTYSLIVYADTNTEINPGVRRQFGLNLETERGSSGNQFLYDTEDFSGNFHPSDGGQAWPTEQAPSNCYVFKELDSVTLVLQVFPFQSSDESTFLAVVNGLQIVTDDDWPEGVAKQP